MGKVASETPVPCAFPMDAKQFSALLSGGQLKSDSEVDDMLQASSADDSAGYVSCSSSLLATTDETPDDLQSVVDMSSSFFQRSKQFLSAASKYRLRCQCGANNCRQYLY